MGFLPARSHRVLGSGFYGFGFRVQGPSSYTLLHLTTHNYKLPLHEHNCANSGARLVGFRAIQLAGFDGFGVFGWEVPGFSACSVSMFHAVPRLSKQITTFTSI